MKALRYLGIAAVAGALLVGETACNSMTNTGKGALIGFIVGIVLSILTNVLAAVFASVAATSYSGII